MLSKFKARNAAIQGHQHLVALHTSTQSLQGLRSMSPHAPSSQSLESLAVNDQQSQALKLAGSSIVTGMPL